MIRENKADNQNVLKGYNMLLYFAGSMIMFEPTDECVTDFWKNGILKQLPVKSMNPRFVKASSQLRDSCEDKTRCAKELCNDYRSLLHSDGIRFTPPYESQYNKDHVTETIRKKETVSTFYASYGWVSKFQGKIADDHLGIELLFLTRLIDKYMVLGDDACKNEMSKEIRRFIDQHILTWLPQWNEHLQEFAMTLSYKGIGNLIYASLEDIKSLLSYSEKPL